MRYWNRSGCLLLALASAVWAQQSWEPLLSSPDPKDRANAARQIGDSPEGFQHLDQLGPLVEDEAETVRANAVMALIKIRTIDTQPLLVQATTDLSARVQTLAVDGLVDFYLPEYVKFGPLASVTTFATAVKRRFSKSTPLTVAAYINVDPKVTAAIGEVIRSGRSEEARANAARAIGVLLGGSELDALLDGARSKNSIIILESVLAIRKLKDPAAGPPIVFLLRDLDPKVKEAVVQTVGQLRTSEAIADLVEIVRNEENERLRMHALAALAKIPDNGQRDLFLSFMRVSGKGLRGAAAEGLGRLGNEADASLIDSQFERENAEGVKLSLAFASVSLGNLVRLDYLVKGLNSRVHRFEARPFLVELARDKRVLDRLYVPLSTGSESQRRHLAFVLSQSGNRESLSHLENLTRDRNDEVARTAIEAMRVLQASLDAKG